MYVCVSMTARTFQLNLQPHAGNERLYLKTSIEREKNITVNSLPSRHASVMLSGEPWDWTPAAWRHRGRTICAWRESRADSSVHAGGNARIAGALEIASHFRMKSCVVLFFFCLQMYRSADACSCAMSHPQDAYCHSDIGEWRARSCYDDSFYWNVTMCVLYNVPWCYLWRRERAESFTRVILCTVSMNKSASLRARAGFNYNTRSAKFRAVTGATDGRLKVSMATQRSPVSSGQSRAEQRFITDAFYEKSRKKMIDRS